MDRAERNGFGVALVGHILLFGALSLGLLSARIPKPPVADTMDVTFTDKVGVTSAAPKIATEAPAPSEAPDQGAPEESAPPPPAPAPEPKPAPPRPAPPKPAPAKPKPAPPKPEPKPEKVEPKPEPKAVPKPEKSEPKPKPQKPTPEPKSQKTKPDKTKPDQTKPTKTKPQKTQPTVDDSAPIIGKAKATPAKHSAGLPSDLLSDLPGDKPGKGKAEKAKGSRLGKDFLKGLSPDKSNGKAAAPNAKSVSPLALSGIGALIKQQVRPNYNPPSGGADSASIVTTLNITMARDGSVSAVEVVGHRGVNDANSAYVKQADDAAIRAVRRSSPLKLPPDLYEGGWENITLNFSPAQMQ